MAFFHTSKLPKRQLYGNSVSIGKNGSNPFALTPSANCAIGAEYVPLAFNLPKNKKNLSISGHSLSDEQFVHNINQIIDRQNFRLIDRTNEMKTEVNQIHIRIDCTGFLPREVQVRAIGSNRLEVHAEHLEYFSHKLAVKKQMHRCYPLPENVDLKRIHCLFTKNGMLQIKLPRVVHDEEGQEMSPPLSECEECSDSDVNVGSA